MFSKTDIDKSIKYTEIAYLGMQGKDKMLLVQMKNESVNIGD